MCCKQLRVIMLLFFITIVSPANGASIDCTKIQNKAEDLICSSSKLLDMDESMAKKYELLMGHTDSTREYRQEQRQWLRLRNRCYSKHCVEREYQKRMIRLEDLMRYYKLIY